MEKSERLRSIPSVDQVLQCNELSEVRKIVAHPILVSCVRGSIEQVRSEFLHNHDLSSDNVLDRIVNSVNTAIQSQAKQSLRPVINATGIILHTNLGRAPLAHLAIERMRAAAAYTNLELDLESGKRNRRAANVMQLLAMATGAEDALVVNNCAAATVLVLQSLASGREVIISRGHLVEIGGGFRLPDVFKSAGVILREVGTTNRTYCSDYHDAISPTTGAIIQVHHSNFAQIGFVTEPSLRELVTSLEDRPFPIIHDIGSGSLYDLSKFGLNEPCVKESIHLGADVCMFSGDKLFGGPQCGIIVGKKRWLERLQSNPIVRALRVDKVTLGALEATTEIHLSGQAFRQLPVLQMLSISPQELLSRCKGLHHKLSAGVKNRIGLVDCESFVGGGTSPGQGLRSYALSVEGTNLDFISKSLRSGPRAIMGRLTENRLLLDLRTIDACDLEYVASRLEELLSDVES